MRWIAVAKACEGLCATPRGSARAFLNAKCGHFEMLGCILRFAGWPERATGATSSSQSYCGTGTGVAVGREFAETHLRSCLHAGLRVSGEFAIPGLAWPKIIAYDGIFCKNGPVELPP